MIASRSLEHTFRMGEMLKAGMFKQAADLNLKIHYTGPASIPFMNFADDPDFEKSRIFCTEAYQEVVFFHPAHNGFVPAAHEEKDIEEALAATQKPLPW